MTPAFARLACLLLVGILTFGVAVAQEIDDCLICHEDEELTKIRGDRVVSLYIDLGMFERSVHGREGMVCIDCHVDLDGLDDEHAEDLEPVACDMCHDDVAAIYDHSLHGRAVAAGNPDAPRCWDCHGAHDILPPSAVDSRVNRFNIPIMCGSCHKEGTKVARMYDIPQDSILTHYSQSIHGEGLFKRGLTITAVCIDCHTAHDVLPHTDPESTIFRGNVPRTCQKCHGRIEQVHQKVIAGELWEAEPHKVPVCIECHQPHEIRRVFYQEGMADRECLDCHGKPDLTIQRGGETLSLYVDHAETSGSAHVKVACAQCHTGATPSHARPCATVADSVDCSICHAEVVAEYSASTHGELLARGDPDAPTCLYCHGTHGMKKKQDPTSPTYVSKIAGLCGECHGVGGVAAERYEGDARGMVENYSASVHGRAVQDKGLVVAATCSDCHTAHSVRRQSDPASSIHRSNIVPTCSQCHEGIFEIFKTSIHFTGKGRDGFELPMCDDCHTSHEISNTKLNRFKLALVQHCAHCHEDITESYFETFHGKVVDLGFTATAKCQDCHGSHDILPKADPASTISRENIVATCAQCHEGSHQRFADFLPHATHHDREKYPFIFWTWRLMTTLLIGTFAFFGLHTLMWLPRSFMAMKHGREIRQQSKGRKEVERFSVVQRNLHILVIISFLSLAVTGMTLKFSYLPWARAISHFLGGFESAGLIHRIAAVVTFFYFGRHLADVHQRRRRSGLSWKDFLLGDNSMLPKKQDLIEFGQTFRWFVGAGPRPRYGRWTYWEKFDYFAVFWGVAMIGFTGLTLWFPEVFTRLLPGSFINIATIIHSDEALLATGFIFTVHFFNTHFRPDKFPMDPAIFTRRVPLEELKEDRPREYENLVVSGELEGLLVDPQPENRTKWFRIFGFTALAIGLTLIVLIIWAELIGYG
ncbi:cytochrome c3 family protein [bacterium]|nr:cytochrome c3 family protein [bacterium]MBU1074132.1 cytochrome c3 family protein [bacterium]MBU1674988.1 cytochrome c3 family protein [bacterium]